jgi:hypothetical protein
MPKPISAGERLDDIARRRYGENVDLTLVEKSRRITDLAREVAYSGSYVARLESVGPEDDPYEYVGTLYVPLDYSRRISVREIPRENQDDGVKIGLKLMTGGETEPDEPILIATFSSEDDFLEFSAYGSAVVEDLDDLKALLEHINNSPEK